MKHVISLLFAFSLMLTSCATYNTPLDIRRGKFVITQYDVTGSKSKIWEVGEYKLDVLKNKVYIVVNGQSITIEGSFGITELVP